MRLEYNSLEKFTIVQCTCSSHRISALLRLRGDFVIRKLVRKQEINNYAAL